MGDKAIGFLAKSGGGKSTLAYQLYKSGYPILSDDHIVLDKIQNPVVYPGSRCVKLMPDAVDFFNGTLKTQKIDNEISKRFVQLEKLPPSKPYPLNKLYVLGVGQQNKIDSIISHQKLVQLVNHTFSIKVYEGRGELEQHFQQCEQLIRQIPMKYLVRKKGLEFLSETKELIIKDNE
jgi:hypothetical protein